MERSARASFETPLGRCAIVWRGGTVIATALPGGPSDRLPSRLADLDEGSPPAEVRQAIDGIVRLLGGEPVDLSYIAVDLESVTAFERRVYAAARAIRVGETRTYGDIAREVGTLGDARAVGRALGRNPWPIVIPCHRVLASGGRSGGFSAPGGSVTKMRMLEIEGARRGPEPMLFDALPWALRG